MSDYEKEMEELGEVCLEAAGLKSKYPIPLSEPTYEDGFADGFARAWQECWELFTKGKGEK